MLGSQKWSEKILEAEACRNCSRDNWSNGNDEEPHWDLKKTSLGILLQVNCRWRFSRGRDDPEKSHRNKTCEEQQKLHNLVHKLWSLTETEVDTLRPGRTRFHLLKPTDRDNNRWYKHTPSGKSPHPWCHRPGLHHLNPCSKWVQGRETAPVLLCPA